MSLKARLKRLEAAVEWLEFDGMLRACELRLELIDKKREIAEHDPAFAAARGWIAAPPKPSPPPQAPPPQAAPQAPPAPAELPQPPPPPTPPQLPPRVVPPPAPPPMTEAWTHDPPEHMQIEKVTWRMHRPQDDLDDEEDEYDEYDV